MKYIMFAKDMGHDTMSFRPVIFPDECVHLYMATVIAQTPEMQGYRAVRAGFIQLPLTFRGRSFDWNTYGKSESLGLQSHPDDAQIIKWYEYGGKVGQPVLAGL